MEDGRKIMRKILELSEKPDAVIAGSDEVAAGMVMEALKGHCSCSCTICNLSISFFQKIFRSFIKPFILSAAYHRNFLVLIIFIADDKFSIFAI